MTPAAGGAFSGNRAPGGTDISGHRPACLPGCERHIDDHDGATYCTTTVGGPVWSVGQHPRPVTVEVDQSAHPDGTGRRMVVIVGDGFPLLLDPADVPALVEALGEARRLAGGPVGGPVRTGR